MYALAVIVFGVHVASPHAVIADSLRSVYVATSLVQHGDLDLDEYASRWGINAFGLDLSGNHVMPLFPWVPSLFALPWVALLRLRQAMGGPVVETLFLSESATWFVQVISMSAVVALTTVLVHRIAWAELGHLDSRPRRRAAFAVALVFAFGTSAWSTASRSLWQHGPSMLMLAATLICALRARRDARWLAGVGACVATAYTIRPTNALPALVFAVWALLVFRRRAAAFLAGALPVALVFVAVNLWGYGRPLPQYYQSRLGHTEAGRQVHLIEALVGNLVSPGRGIFVFTPVLVLAIVGFIVQVRRREVTPLTLAVGVCLGGHWVAISLFAHWWGGHSFGPRLFTDMTVFFIYMSVPALEALILLGRAGHARLRAALLAIVVALAGVGVVVHAQGALLRSSWCWNVGPVDVEEDPSRLWDWHDPQAIRGLRAAIGPSTTLREEVRRAALIHSGCPEF